MSVGPSVRNRPCRSSSRPILAGHVRLSVYPYEHCDLGNYKSCNTGISVIVQSASFEDRLFIPVTRRVKGNPFLYPLLVD